MATGERARQEHLIVSQFSGDMNAVQSAYQQPPLLLGTDAADGLSIPSSLPMSVPTGLQPKQIHGGTQQLIDDQIQNQLQSHNIQGQMGKVEGQDALGTS